MAPLITLAVLCRQISNSREEGFTVHGIADDITLLDEEGPLRVFGVFWIFPRESGPHDVRAVVLAPSGQPASNEYRLTEMLREGVTKKDVLEFSIAPAEQGRYWFVVEVGPESEARFPMVIRWAPDSARARRRRLPPE